MIFKKKYKRSEWFEGLLQTEQLIQDGFVKDTSTTAQMSGERSILHFWFKHEDKPYSIGIDGFKLEYCKGVIDYLEHCKRNK